MSLARHRILVVAPVPGEVVRRVVERHVITHDLPWDLTFVDTAEWGDAHPSHDLSQTSFDAMVGWCPLPVWNWLDRHPIRAVVWTSARITETMVGFQPDDAAIGRLAAQHLHLQGVRCVATVRSWNFPARQQRFGAFLAEAARLGLETRRFESRFDLDALSADAALVAWLRAAPHPLGVFLHQDRDALSFMRTCLQHGVRVPDEVAVLGVDDRPAAALATPPLSSIILPVAGIAAAMVLELHRLLGGATRAGHVVHIAPLRVAARASTGPFQTGDPLIDRLRTRISAAPGGNHVIPALAAKAGLSVSQLHRRFQAACGLTPGQFLRSCRLHLAQDLLSTTELPLTKIALRCGLVTAAGLWSAFRSAGLPAPAVWRALQRGDEPLVTGA